MSRRAALPALAALLLAGCAAVPPVEPQVAQVAPGALGLDPAARTAIADRWWTAFGDPQLDRLVEAGLAGNPDLAAALARVRAAQAAIGARQADSLPQVSADAQSPRQRFPEHYIMPSPIGGSTFWVPQVDAGLNWDLDLFGRNKAAVAQARAGARAAGLDAAAARLTIATAIAQAYIGLAHAARLQAVADGFVATREQALDLVRTRVRTQLASDFDLRQAQTLLAEARQAQVRATEQHDLMIHALAALVGRGADFYGQITPPTLALDDAPALPDALPADLLGRRPDLLAALARIDAASAGREIARAQFMPNVNISALAGFLSLGLDNLFKGGSVQWSAGPAIHLPIFEGGRLRADYRGATAGLDEAVASYDGAVVRAVRDASDAITQVRSADRDLAAQADIVGGLRETVRLDQVRVSTGLGSRLDAVESGFRLLEAEQGLVDLQAQALRRRVQLIAALGGGFDPNRTAQAATHAGDPQS